LTIANRLRTNTSAIKKHLTMGRLIFGRILEKRIRKERGGGKKHLVSAEKKNMCRQRSIRRETRVLTGESERESPENFAVQPARKKSRKKYEEDNGVDRTPK